MNSYNNFTEREKLLSMEMYFVGIGVVGFLASIILIFCAYKSWIVLTYSMKQIMFMMWIVMGIGFILSNYYENKRKGVKK